MSTPFTEFILRKMGSSTIGTETKLRHTANRYSLRVYKCVPKFRLYLYVRDIIRLDFIYSKERLYS
jgi:hypothetical protein